MLTTIARIAADRPKSHLAAILVAFAVAGIFGPPVADLLSSSTDSFYNTKAESSQVLRSIEKATGAQTAPAVVAILPANDADALAKARSAMQTRDMATVEGGPAAGPAFVSTDGKLTYLAATARAGADPAAAAKPVVAKLERIDGVKIGGIGVVSQEINDQIKHDLARAEAIAFPILFLVSLWVFRSLVAALMPLFVGGMTIVVSMSIVRIINTQLTMSTFALNLITGLGLGLAIDYSLFIVSRYREELQRQGPGGEALATTMRTAGKTVIFSALTVAGAGVALWLFPLRFLYSMGIGVTVVALVAATIAVLGLAPILALLGPRINAGTLPVLRRAAEAEARNDHQGAWYRWSRIVMRRPVVAAVLGAAFLIALGLPFSRVQFAGADVTTLPPGASGRVAAETLADRFPSAGPQNVVTVRASADDAAALGAFRTTLADIDHVDSVSEPKYVGGDLWVVNVYSTAKSATDSTATGVVRAIRAVENPPGTVQVGGFTAQNVDQSHTIVKAIPWGLTVLAVLTFIILFVMTGSVVLPIKALIMNVLTISAAFGLLVLVFQDGRLQGPLNYVSDGALESTQPVLIFALIFGLSTDYAVFLLTRIKEARDAGAGERKSVAIGLQHTGRIVTAAAILFAIAIGAFATSEIVMMKELGLGVAAAVLIDAFIVRAVLVPSLMALLGRWNWWSPGPLRRLHDRIGVTEG